LPSALRAEKLIYLTDVPGILENGELVSEISASDLTRKIADGTIKGGMVAKTKSVLRAIEGGGGERAHHRRTHASLGDRGAVYRSRCGDVGEEGLNGASIACPPEGTGRFLKVADASRRVTMHAGGG